eukprot:gene12279-13544_t
MEAFHAELDGFDIHLPGDNVIPFSKKDGLEKFITCQYPKWKEKGKVTSIPEARIPRLFLYPDQMTRTFKNRYTSLHRGESGEIKVYKLFLETAKLGECGILMFPNVDGNHFKSKIAHVEIDIVVIHPFKGVFIVNIKNATIQPVKIANDVKKHGDFIDSLAKYGANNVTVPIYSLVCSLKHNYDVGAVTSQLKKDADKCFNLQPMEMEDFSSHWKSLLTDIPDITEKDIFEALNDLSARMVALNSMEGSICLIHKKIVGGDMYKKRGNVKDFTNKMVKETFVQSDNVSVSKDKLSNRLAQLQLNNSKHESLSGGKRSVILWTKEQLDILKEVGTRLMDSKSKKMRILISGPKGSGKTVLLSYLAYLAKNIFTSQHSWKDGDVIIADGRCGSSLLLFEKLKEDFDGTGISVYGDVEGMQKLTGKIVLIDECNAGLKLKSFVSNLQDIQGHIIIFTSRSAASSSFCSYQHLTLTNTLRATAGLVCFCEEFRSLESGVRFTNVPGTPAHNLESGAPDIRCYTIDVAKDPLQLGYVESCLAAINEVMQKSRGLKNVLLTPYVHPITLQRIMHQIQQKGYDCEFRNPLDVLSYGSNLGPSSTSKSNLQDTSSNGTSASPQDTVEFPKMIFVTGNHVDGAEYGAVIVLLERSLPPWWNNYIFDSLYIAITRATVSLSVLVNNTEETPLIACKHRGSAEEKPSLWSNVDESSDVDIHSFREIPAHPADFVKHLEEITYTNRNIARPTLVFGRLQNVAKWTKIDPPIERIGIKGTKPRNESVKWFELPNGSKIISVDGFQISSFFIEFRELCFLVGLSSIVILTSTQAEISDLFRLNRHGLQFVVYDYQLLSCPIYLLTPYRTPSARLDTSEIFNFLSSKSQRTFKDPEERREEMVATAQTWQCAKKLGTEFLNEGKLHDALNHYKDSFRILKGVYRASLTTEKLKQVINYREEMAKLCTNISKVYLDLGAVSKHENPNNAEMSLQFANKSVEMCPTWDKGYYRIIQASLILGADTEATTAKEKRERLRLRAQKLNQSHRYAVITEMMHASACWKLLKYQDNAFLVDQNGDGHFNSVVDAVAENRRKPVSLLINPGIYKGCIFLIKDKVDIVGNCTIKTCEKKEWIIENPCVVLQGGDSLNAMLKNTIVVAHSHLYLTRVSVYNWRPDGFHAMFGYEASHIEVTECAFLSKCGAAICAESRGTDILLSSSRFTNCYGAVLALDGCSMSLKKCFVEKTKVSGVELRNNVTALIQDCTLKDCEGQGLTTSDKCKIEVDGCVFINNGTRKGASEGSLQLHDTNAFISKSQVLDQIGCGIVIEYGKGKFEGVTIDRCRSSGILTQAPIHVKQCTIRNCIVAVSICPFIKGQIRLESNTIMKCMQFYTTAVSSPHPILINNSVKTKCERNITLPMPEDPLMSGKHFHEKILTNRRILQTGQVYSSMDDIKGLINEERSVLIKYPYPICSCCNVRKMHRDETYFLCSCEMIFYCSKKCAQKDKDMHKPHCNDYKKTVQLYRKSINWKDETKVKSPPKKPAKADGEKCYRSQNVMAVEEIQPSTAKSVKIAQSTKKRSRKKKKTISNLRYSVIFL